MSLSNAELVTAFPPLKSEEKRSTQKSFHPLHSKNELQAYQNKYKLTEDFEYSRRRFLDQVYVLTLHSINQQLIHSWKSLEVWKAKATTRAPEISILNVYDW